jgi:hypothetical protein
VRLSYGFAVVAALSLAPRLCRAEERDAAPALFVGAAVLFAGFTAGGLVVASSNGDATKNNAGWLTMESGLALAPFAAHAVTGEWGRGLAFAAVPAAATAGTAALFEYDPGTVVHGSLPEQRWLWSMFGVALAASTAGIVDALFAGARARSVTVAPAVASGQAGLLLRGAL